MAVEARAGGRSGVIEVYPAATLKVLAGGERLAPYKKPEQTDARRAIVTVLADLVELTTAHRERAIGSDHLLDAIACVVAGADFLARRAMEPPAELLAVAKREGWIWVRGLVSAPA